MALSAEMMFLVVRDRGVMNTGLDLNGASVVC